MIEVRGLTKCYGERKAINNLNFQIKKGEIVGFLGPNGAGKTTTMKILTGFMAPTSGAVQMSGYDVFENPIEVKKRIGYLPETPPVYGDMTVQNYLMYVARLKGVSNEVIKQNVEWAIQKTLLGEVRGRLIQNLSKGFRQRVGLAQAICNRPEILILDEPTVGLDPRQVAEIRNLLTSLRGEHTIILSTHILPEVQAICDRVIIINQGQIVAEDTLAGLSSQSPSNMRLQLRVLRDAGRLAKVLRALTCVQDVTEEGLKLTVTVRGDENTIEDVIENAVKEKCGLVTASLPDNELERIFIQLTTRN